MARLGPEHLCALCFRLEEAEPEGKQQQGGRGRFSGWQWVGLRRQQQGSRWRRWQGAKILGGRGSTERRQQRGPDRGAATRGCRHDRACTGACRYWGRVILGGGIGSRDKGQGGQAT